MPARRPEPASPLTLLASLAGQVIIVCLFSLFVLENQFLAAAFVSESLWVKLISVLGGEVRPSSEGLLPQVSLAGLCLATTLLCCGWTILSAVCRRRSEKTGFVDALHKQAIAHLRWTWPIGVWSLCWIINSLLPDQPLARLLILTPSLAAAVTLAGWGWQTTRWGLPTNPKESRWIRWSVWGGAIAYVVVFVAMNWGLWFSLRLPHGDSSMYEEHLWNTLHGKGFRSYLDQGLFLGEHIQVGHLLLIPFYLLWPSHLMLELLESVSLALVAWPMFRMTKRFTGSELAAGFAALAALLYFPSHYMDIAIDLKTFRPETLGIPALAFALDFLEQRRWKSMLACVLITLSTKEDYAIVLAPLGLWMAVDAWLQQRRNPRAEFKPQLIYGALLCVLSTAYLGFVVKFAIPWFRDGAQVHYASYFQTFGSTPSEIVWNLLTKPHLLFTQLVTAGTIAYLLQLLVPLGVPWRGWSRLLVAAPLFVTLCLNELVLSTPGPFHHFHAPLIPILLWGACAALGAGKPEPTLAAQRGLWMLWCGLTTALFFSLSPFGIRFWDSGSGFHWRKLYVPDQRAEEFAKVFPLIPTTARVASTDFIHPRFTHHERSYDYSDYPRRVANYEPRVPDDTDYIVLDTQHPYSKVRRPEEVRELKTEPEKWEVVPVETGGYYIVLKRRSDADAKP